jgi:hypothetical protein
MDELTEADLLYVLDSIGAIESLDGSRSEKDLQVLRQMRLFEVAEGVLAEVEIPPRRLGRRPSVPIEMEIEQYTSSKQ